mmetsp:Transcript_9083/g.16623  ORF Transcript_9083/g.16623 Transcript_9083/m.16623 type:complete len:99 (+) Transcript_9083:52-348(+)
MGQCYAQPKRHYLMTRPTPRTRCVSVQEMEEEYVPCESMMFLGLCGEGLLGGDEQDKSRASPFVEECITITNDGDGTSSVSASSTVGKVVENPKVRDL